jgi:excisionase family DNA binding protein
VPTTRGVVGHKKARVEFLTVLEVAETLRVSKMTVYRMIHNEILPSFKFGGTYRIPTRAVIEYIQSSRIASGEGAA